MTHAKYLVLTISLIYSNVIFAQPPQTIDVEQAIEALFNLPDATINYEEFYERYFLLYEKPLALNSATFDELKNLHVFSNEEIDEIISYRESVGRIFSIYELIYLKEVDPNKIKLISPFLSAENQNNQKFNWSQLKKHKKVYLITRYEYRFEQARVPIR